MKKNTLFIIAAAIVFMASCKKETSHEDNFLSKTLSGMKGEVREIAEADYAELGTANDGEVTLEIMSNPNDIYRGYSPYYFFSGSIVSSNTTSVVISTPTATNTFNFVSASGGTRQIYATAINETANPTYLAGYFSKSTTVKIYASVSAATPPQITLGVPTPIVITGPVYNPDVVDAWNIGSNAVFQWTADPSNKNGVIVRVKNLTTGGRYFLLTQDDGSLPLSAISSYAPASGPFEIALCRLNYGTITAGTKQYRVVFIANSINQYNLVP